MAGKNKGGSGFAIGFILGGIIGAIVGIMLAPKSGSDTRKEIQDIGRGWRTMAEEVASSIQDQVVPAVGDAGGRLGPTVGGLRENVEPSIGAVRQRVTSGVEEISARVRRQSENGVEAEVPEPNSVQKPYQPDEERA